MATLDALKRALRQKARTLPSSPSPELLSDTEYSAGFDILLQGPGWTTYRDFIIPQLSQLLAPLFNSRSRVSVLEIGPGPKSVLGHLPSQLRQKVKEYSAYEPNAVFATRLQEWLCHSSSAAEVPLPSLENPSKIHLISFALDDNIDQRQKYDVVLFCHSMYGMKPKRSFIEQALGMLVDRPQGAMVVVFHRDGPLFDGLVCHRTASFPTGVVRVADDDQVLDRFATFVAGFTTREPSLDSAVRRAWREVCRSMSGREETHPSHLWFSAPEVLVAFTQHATSLTKLTAQVPMAKTDWRVKSREAQLHRPAAVLRPTNIQQVQQCVHWALKHGAGLTIVGGGHSGHCLQPNVVSIDMGAFDQIHILTRGDDHGSSSRSLVVVAETGCKTGDIIRKTMAAGLTVPLGARPSVGAGLWLQGGIGHLARLRGLTCDAIIGAVVVSVASGQLFCIGAVPSQHQPAGAVCPENASDLLWAIKGAGTNFGIVVSVTFQAHPAQTYFTRNWVVPLRDELEARRKLPKFGYIARKFSRSSAADAYLYWDAGQLHLGVTTYEACLIGEACAAPTAELSVTLGQEHDCKAVDSVGMFETEMYMSGMHGGHAGGKTSSFKRCLFLRDIRSDDMTNRLVAAVSTRPSHLCYLHLLHGGGAVGDVPASATAFGCRDWDFACVITGVWPRDQDDTEVAHGAVRWVYSVARDLLDISSGVYSADLGPDPRDVALAEKAFGPNLSRLARLKRSMDPRNVLAYACPLPKAPMEPKLILLVTGEHCAGKDYCAEVWVSVLTHRSIAARTVSISDAIKREYAAASGANLNRLLEDRAYKEKHRPKLTAFFNAKVRQHPWLPEQHFLDVVYGAVDVDVLFITGMRDKAPVAAFSHLVPDSRLLEVYIQVDEHTRRDRGRHQTDSDNTDSNEGRLTLTPLDHCPSLIFDNNTAGDELAKQFAEHNLIPFLHDDLQRLADMVRPVPDFPRFDIEFRHVLGIAQQPGGLTLCTSLLRDRFCGDWAEVHAVACCEAGGFVYASALASRVNVPLVLIREAGKLPPPTVSVVKSPSYISSSGHQQSETRIEMEQNVVPKGASVVVVDDVFSTGETLCALLQLLREAGVDCEKVQVLVVAEFPVHHGRKLLQHRGFGRTRVQSLLVFGGA